MIDVQPIKDAPLNSDLLKDPELFDLVEAFRDKIPARISELNQFIEKKQYDEAKAECHKLKGTAAMYGFMELAAQLAILEAQVLKARASAST